VYEPVGAPNAKLGVLVAGVPPADVPALDVFPPPPKRPGVPDGFAAPPANENALVAGVEAPDVAAPKSPPPGLLVAGVFELPNKFDGPELEVAAAPPNRPPPDVLELVFVVLPALPKMDEVPPVLAAVPKRGLLGVLLPPPVCGKLKAIVREYVGCAVGGSFRCVRMMWVLLSGSLLAGS
jgi:hypothetical protein